MKIHDPYDDSVNGKSVQFHDDKGVACYGTILGPDKKAKNRIAYMVSRNGASGVGYYSRALYEVEILLIGETRDKPTARLRGDDDEDEQDDIVREANLVAASHPLGPGMSPNTARLRED